MPKKAIATKMIPDAVPAKFPEGSRVSHVNEDGDTFEGTVVRVVPEWQFNKGNPMIPRNLYVVKFDGYDEEETHTEEKLSAIEPVEPVAPDAPAPTEAIAVADAALVEAPVESGPEEAPKRRRG